MTTNSIGSVMSSHTAGALATSAASSTAGRPKRSDSMPDVGAANSPASCGTP